MMIMHTECELLGVCIVPLLNMALPPLHRHMAEWKDCLAGPLRVPATRDC